MEGRKQHFPSVSHLWFGRNGISNKQMICLSQIRQGRRWLDWESRCSTLNPLRERYPITFKHKDCWVLVKERANGPFVPTPPFQCYSSLVIKRTWPLDLILRKFSSLGGGGELQRLVLQIGLKRMLRTKWKKWSFWSTKPVWQLK